MRETVVSRPLLLRRCIFICVTSLVMFLLLTASGCKKASTEKYCKEDVVYAINQVVKSSHWPLDVRNRADLAISKWQNHVLDFNPILVCSCLVKPTGIDKIDLVLATFDEDKDVLGFVIKEEYTSLNGQRYIIEETYPIYTHAEFVQREIVNLNRLSPEIRTKDERKDNQLWQKYIESDYKKLLQEYKTWEATLPPVWVSIPQPDKIDVWVYVYDKAGNKSEAIKLLDFTKISSEN